MSITKVRTTSGKVIELRDKNEINRGGEGKILTIDNMPDKVAKIYFKPNMNRCIEHYKFLQKLQQFGIKKKAIK